MTRLHAQQRRSIHRQLNKQENISWLEDQIFYGNDGKIRLHSLDRQIHHPSRRARARRDRDHHLEHRQMNAIIARRQAAGEEFDDEQLGWLSPAICEHILINALPHRPPPRRGERLTR